MSDFLDEDGIDGPFDRAISRAIREDSAKTKRKVPAHTPGEWLQDPTGDVGWWLIGTVEKPIAHVVTEDKFCGLSKSEARANARVLGAASDLLRAMLKARHAVDELHAQGIGCPDCQRDNPDGSPVCALIDEIGLAIQKAGAR